MKTEHTSQSVKNPSMIISTLIFSIVLAGISLFGITQWMQLRQMQLANEARYQCAISSRYTTVLDKEKGVEVWYPVADLYSKCLTEKGIQ